MYAIRLHIKPTSTLTFRVLPGSMLHISTYPFVPPSTLSGFLKRLALLTTQKDNPNERSVYPETDVERGRGRTKRNPPYYTLPTSLISVGAYPRLMQYPDKPSRNFRIHQSYRHGPREFSHSDFSKMRKEAKVHNLQLHTWEYLFTDYLVAYVLAEDGNFLSCFKELVGYGTKLGKEGYAYLEAVDDPFPLDINKIEAPPSSLVPLESANVVLNATTYQIYYHRWQQGRASPAIFENSPSPVDGFNSILAVFVSDLNQTIKTEYYHNGNELYISKGLVDKLKDGFRGV